MGAAAHETPAAVARIIKQNARQIKAGVDSKTLAMDYFFGAGASLDGAGAAAEVGAAVAGATGTVMGMTGVAVTGAGAATGTLIVGSALLELALACLRS